MIRQTLTFIITGLLLLVMPLMSLAEMPAKKSVLCPSNLEVSKLLQNPEYYVAIPSTINPSGSVNANKYVIGIRNFAGNHGKSWGLNRPLFKLSVKSSDTLKNIEVRFLNNPRREGRKVQLGLGSCLYQFKVVVNGNASMNKGRQSLKISFLGSQR